MAILVRDELDLNLNSVSSDDDGRFVMIEYEVQGYSFLLVNIYAPDSVQDQGGDLNVTLDPAWDCSGGNLSKNASVKYIEDLCLDFDLVDIWRIRNPEVKRFTWREKNPIIQRRFDLTG